MKVLMLCNKSPFPALEGGAIAMDSMIRGLIAQGVEVYVLALESEKYGAGSLPADLQGKIRFNTAKVDLRIKAWPALVNLLNGRSYHVERFRSKELTHSLGRILSDNKFDIIQFETPYLGHYLPMVRTQSRARLVLRAHNIEHLVWYRLAEGSRGPLKKWYITQLSKALERFERRFTIDCDGVAPITDKDAEWFRGVSSKDVVTVPFGKVFSEEMAGASHQPDQRIFHLGSMNWRPNEEGIRWFLTEVWPKVRQGSENAELHLAGRHMPEWVYRGSWPGLVVHGEVDDAGRFMQEFGIMIVPLLSGSGMRIKIIEGMEAGRAIVSTHIGAEGIQCKQGEHILLADDATTFADNLLRLSDNPDLRATLGRQASQYVRKVYSLESVTERMLELYHKIM